MTISLIFCLIIVLLLVMCVLVLLLAMKRMQDRQNAMEENIQQMSELNAKLRSSRHDYLNNLQIVYGMLELEEYEELHNYLEPMYKDIMKTGKALKTAKPAVNALLMAKLGEAEKENIDFYIEVKSNLKDIAIPDWELCRILSNLIDNAFRAVKSKEEQQVEAQNSASEDLDKKVSANRKSVNKTGGKVLVDIIENAHSYIFSIIDNGVSIPEEMKEELFKQGFTTKNQKEGHGMGLYIVSRIVTKYKGRISLHTENNEKNFQVIFEKGGSL